jgi:hypothetical protein
MKRLLVPLFCLFLLGCIPSAAKKDLRMLLATSSGFLKNVATVAAEKDVDGKLVGPAKVKAHVQSLAADIAKLDADATSAARAAATQALVDHPETLAAYDDETAGAIAAVQELHSLSANYAKNALPTSSVAGDEEFLTNIDASITALCDDVLGQSATTSIKNAVTGARPAAPTTTQSAQQSAAPAPAPAATSTSPKPKK